MPKPSFLQAVLRKPTRSYADPYYVPPWSDNYDYEYEQEQEQYSRPVSRYSARKDEGVFLGYREGHEPEAGPSKPRKVPKAPRSVISTVSEEGAAITPKTRFPKAARRVASSVVVRGGHVVEILDERDEVPSRSSTVKKKKKTTRSRRGSDDAETVVTVSRPNTPAASTRSARRVRRTEPEYDDELDGESVVSVSRSTNKTPSLQSRNRLQPSESSSSSVPVSLRDDPPSLKRQSNLRMQPTAIQGDVANGRTPLSPPDSLRSSTESSLHEKASSPLVQSHPASRPGADERRTALGAENTQKKRVSVVQEETDGDENFFTPRQSMDVRPASSANIPTIIPPASDATLPPTLQVQPPTPAPLEIDASPFHSEPSSKSSSLHPSQAVQPSNPQPYFEPPSTAARHNEDAHSEASENGSDEDVVAERKRPKSRADSNQNQPTSFSGRATPTPLRVPSRPPSVAQSVPAGSVNGDPRPSRPSENVHGPGFKRRYSTPLSEQSFGGRSVQSGKEGSIRSSVSGFGKGGWAAAAAASTARSGASSPVMYMPSGGSDGWASFHVPTRQSKFTPLPAASQPMTFDRLVRDNVRDHPIAASAPASRMGDRHQPLRADPHAQSAKSSASSYSQAVEEEESSSEEEDDLPLPSRSYAKALPDSPAESPPLGGETPVDSLHSSVSRLSSSNSVPPVPPPKNPSRGMLAQLSQYGSESSLQEPEDQPVPRTTSVYTQNVAHVSEANGPLRSNGVPQLAPPLSTADFVQYSPDQSQEPSPYSSRHSSPTATRPTSPSLSRPNTPGARAFDTPSFLNPDVLTILPEMTAEDSARLYQSAASESGRSKRASWNDHSRQSIKRSTSLWGGRARSARSEVGRAEDENDHVDELPRRSQSVMGFRKSVNGSKWGGSSYGDGQIMQSDGVAESIGGYTNLVLPSGAYTPGKASKSPNVIDPKVLGLPHATMAAITLSTSAHRLPMTPMHLRTNLPPPVDFTSHLKPPTKTGDGQLLVQVYAAAVDAIDIDALEEKGLRDVGKWVPGRSFVGRCLMVGAAEKDIVRGDIIIGLLDIRKVSFYLTSQRAGTDRQSGALAEYILVDRRRVARAPYPTGLTLEQLALLPLEGIAATRAIRTHLVRHSRALIMDAHTSVGALMCQEMSRAGVYVVGLIGGGDNHHEAQTACMRNGAKGVMTGSPAAVMNGMDEWAWDFVLDTVGGPRVYEAAKRILKDQATLVSTVSPEPSMPAGAQKPKATGFKAFRNAFRSRKKDQKHIVYEYLPASASGEAEVDSSGMDCRDILEEPCMSTYKPEVRYVYPLERGMEAFHSPPETSVVRLIH